MHEAISLDPAMLSSCFESQGMYAWGFLGPQEFRAVLDRREVGEATRARYGLESLGGAAVVALRYGDLGEVKSGVLSPDAEPGSEAAKDQPLKIGRFARANWYAELLERLSTAAREFERKASETLGHGFRTPSPAWRRLVNSGLPEKPLALAAGLGWIGKNGILIARGRGAGAEVASSAVVLGILILPAELSLESPHAAGGEDAGHSSLSCGTCRECVKACPTSALDDSTLEMSGMQGTGLGSRVRAARFEREKCMQHWASIEGELPPEIGKAWGTRLYGCDSCLEACPFFRPDPEARTGRGLIGSELSARKILAATDAELRAALKGSALDRSWIAISALRRSAEIALRNRGGVAAPQGTVYT